MLGFSGSSANGSTKLLLKLALEAVKAAGAPPGSSASLVCTPDVSVPKRSLNASNVLPKTDASIDGRPFVLDLALDASAIVLCCPIYARVIPGSVKLFQDKTPGPFVDRVMARHRKEGVAARFEKKRVA